VVFRTFQGAPYTIKLYRVLDDSVVIGWFESMQLYLSGVPTSYEVGIPYIELNGARPDMITCASYNIM